MSESEGPQIARYRNGKIGYDGRTPAAGCTVSRRAGAARLVLGFVSATFACLTTACAASSRPATNPQAAHSIAPALGARVTKAGCALGSAELADRTVALWRVRPWDDAWGPDWKCVAIEDNLGRDLMSDCTPPPDATLARPLPFPRRIMGELFYLGIDPREYAYDLVPRRGGIEVEVRVQFTGSYARDPVHLAAVQRKMDQAAELWTRSAPNGSIHFRFVAVTGEDAWPHFDVKLAPGDARTPFDVTWGAEWSAHLIAHEIGHMMGLDDEYGQLRKTLGHAVGADALWDRDPLLKVHWFQCDPHSLMCDSKGEQSTPQRYHYYAILRRRYCRAGPSEAPPF